MYDEKRRQLANEYWRLTAEVMPAEAADRGWPVDESHCFQRIILDNVVGGVWYDKIADPAIKHVSKSQLRKAVRLCDDLLMNRTDFHELNRRSLEWRKAAKKPPGEEAYIQQELSLE
jgi:hypothetical protein